MEPTTPTQVEHAPGFKTVPRKVGNATGSGEDVRAIDSAYRPPHVSTKVTPGGTLHMHAAMQRTMDLGPLHDAAKRLGLEVVELPPLTNVEAAGAPGKPDLVIVQLRGGTAQRRPHVRPSPDAAGAGEW